MATTLSRMVKKAASSVIPLANRTTPHRNFTSAIFTTPLKISTNLFRTTSIPTHHHFSALAKKRSDSDDTLLDIIESEIDCAKEEFDHLEAEEPNASLDQVAHEGPDEELDERHVQQAFNEKNRGSLVRSRSPSLNRTRSPSLSRAISRLGDLYRDSTFISGSPYKYSRKRSIKKINLPTHYCEVNYRTLKAVVFYGPNIDHIPHGISKKDLNLLGVHQAKP